MQLLGSAQQQYRVVKQASQSSEVHSQAITKVELHGCLHPQPVVHLDVHGGGGAGAGSQQRSTGALASAGMQLLPICREQPERASQSNGDCECSKRRLTPSGAQTAGTGLRPAAQQGSSSSTAVNHPPE